MSRRLVLGTLLITAAAWPAPADFTAVAAGQPQCAIYIGQFADAVDQFAARELQDYFAKITGVTVPIVSRFSDLSKDLIVVGVNEISREVARDLQSDEATDETFIIRTMPHRLYLLGNQRRGTLYAAYELLHRLGVRWFMPGEMGEWVPSTPDLVVPATNLLHTPALHRRSGISWGYGTWDGMTVSLWALRNRFNYGVGRKPGWGPGHDYSIGGSGHSYQYLVPPDKYFEEHPEYYSLINGERTAGPGQWQLCTTNPDVVKIAADTLIEWFDENPTMEACMVSPNDGRGFCQCPDCQALDDPDLPGSMTNRVVDFINRVAPLVREKYPNKLLMFYVYDCYYEPPTLGIELDPNLGVEIVAWGSVGSNHAHPLQESEKFSRIMNSWLKLLGPDRVYVHTYYGHYGWITPWPMIHCIREEVPWFARLGLEGMYSETHQHWGTQAINFYVWPRVMFNPDEDVDALLTDYYNKCYEGAAEPMRRYFETLEASMASQTRIGGNLFEIPMVFTPQVLEKCRQALEDAAQTIKPGPPAWRLDLLQKGWKGTELMVGALTAQKDMRYDEAVDYAQQLVDYVESVKDTSIFEAQPYNLAPYLAGYVLEQCQKEGAAFLTAKPGYELLTLLPSQARFKLDPEDVGLKEEWFAEGLAEADWDEVKTGQWWEQQGYDYDGCAWYRLSFTPPAEAQGEELVLSFGGVDEEAWVYLNGELIGEHSEASTGKTVGEIWDEPFDVPLPDTLRFNQPNLLAVRVYDATLMGGIFKPINLLAKLEGPAVQEFEADDDTVLLDHLNGKCLGTWHGRVEQYAEGVFPYLGPPANLCADLAATEEAQAGIEYQVELPAAGEISMWLWIDDTSRTQVIFQVGSGGNTKLSLTTYRAQQLIAYVIGEKSHYAYTPKVPTKTWLKVAVQWDKQGLRIFINDQNLAEWKGDATPYYAGPDFLCIGDAPTWSKELKAHWKEGDHFVGRVDEFRLQRLP